MAPSICAWPLSEFSKPGTPITPFGAEAGVLLRADVHVVGDRQVVEATRGRHGELLPDPEAERVEVLGPGVVVGRPAVGVV